MKQLKIGIIGSGLAWERLHLPAFQELKEQYQIVACCDVEIEKAIKAAEKIALGREKAYSNYLEMIKQEKLDAVDIMVPIPENFHVAEDVAKTGVNIICEKPSATNLEEAEAFANFSKEYGIQVMIAENFRYNEENNIIRDLLNAGKIGDVIYFISNYIVDFTQERLGDTFAAKEWRQHPQFPGGRLLDGAIHNLAGIRHIFGAIDSLHAFGRPEREDYAPYISTNINFKFKSGVVGQFSYYPSGSEMQRPLIGTRIFGTEGMIHLEERGSGVINIAYNDGNTEQIVYRPKRGFYNELLNFYNALTAKEVISVTPEMAYGDLKTVMAILKSVEENRVVQVDEKAVLV